MATEFHLSERDVHVFSQLVYLDAVPKMGREGPITVERLAAFYTKDQEGSAYLQARFAGIPREYQGWQDFLGSGVADYGDWQIEGIVSENQENQSGFYGCCYTGPQGARVFAFRGSELLGDERYRPDYQTDFALSYSPRTPQHLAVDRYWGKVQRLTNRPFYVTGHSLGANLATHGAICSPKAVQDNLIACYAFNGPGFNKEYLAENNIRLQSVQNRIFNMQNKYDPVSSILQDPVKPVILSSTFSPRDHSPVTIKDVFYPHSNFVFAAQSPQLFQREPGGKKDDFCRKVHIIIDLFQKLPDSLRRSVAEILLDVTYSVAGITNKKSYQTLEQATKRIHQSGLVTRVQSSALMVLLYGAKQLAMHQPSVDSLYRSTQQEGHLKEGGMEHSLLLLLTLMARWEEETV